MSALVFKLYGPLRRPHEVTVKHEHITFSLFLYTVYINNLNGTKRKNSMKKKTVNGHVRK